MKAHQFCGPMRECRPELPWIARTGTVYVTGLRLAHGFYGTDCDCIDAPAYIPTEEDR